MNDLCITFQIENLGCYRTRYQSTISEWAKLINAPKEDENDTDVYAKPRKDHNSMANM